MKSPGRRKVFRAPGQGTNTSTDKLSEAAFCTSGSISRPSEPESCRSDGVFVEEPRKTLGIGVICDTRESIPPPPKEDEHFQQELMALFMILPDLVVTHLQSKATEQGRSLYDLVEVYLQIGRRAEAVFVSKEWRKERVHITETAVTDSDIQMFASTFNGVVPTHKRIGVPGTLHRISLITHPARDELTVVGVTARVGRVVQGTVERMAAFLLEPDHDARSLVLIGKPGVGKTTVLRELARLLSQRTSLNVVVVDKTCEIAGDSSTPHSAIGSARWMPVGTADHQAAILREAVENQSPDVIIVDEISTLQEVEAARTISQRGVRLIATIHGDTLPEILNCKERGNLFGGQMSVAISDSAAAMRADKRKTVSKRAREPVFNAALELHEREKWIYHPKVKLAVDTYFNGEPVDAQELTPGLVVKTVALPDEDPSNIATPVAWLPGLSALYTKRLWVLKVLPALENSVPEMFEEWAVSAVDRVLDAARWDILPGDVLTVAIVDTRLLICH
eukprot:CAMPEP_0114257624 /NCGR_PEP_ID=MMETSP0058-20121206/18838_1 /TAXON_ID=36894 /ORGANISM="Pyramimonas parkeae, CCMP726" /LENGTH=506 /DNA_ID=CAMNT_0001372375 /DNA_START=237 /DNA_END=1758 /DNA_ORIENTATION=+